MLLSEKLVILSLDAHQGRYPNLDLFLFDYVLTAAILLDLNNEKEIEIDASNRIRLNPGIKTTNSILIMAKTLMSESNEEREIYFWIHKLRSNSKHYLDATMHNLIDQKIISETDERFLAFFHRKRYPIENVQEEEQTISKIHNLVIEHKPLENSDKQLCALLYESELLSVIFDKNEENDATDEIVEQIHQDKTADIFYSTMEKIRKEVYTYLTEAEHQFPYPF